MAARATRELYIDSIVNLTKQFFYEYDLNNYESIKIQPYDKDFDLFEYCATFELRYDSFEKTFEAAYLLKSFVKLIGFSIPTIIIGPALPNTVKFSIDSPKQGSLPKSMDILYSCPFDFNDGTVKVDFFEYLKE